MHSFTNLFRFRLLALAVLALFASGSLAAEQLYTCGMHPQIIKRAPGNCPICGMKLTPIRANNAAPGAVSPTGERKIKYYQSTMNPGEVKPTPGKDSMGIEMVPVYEEGAPSGGISIQIDSATMQRMNLKTGLVEHGPVRREFRVFGSVDYNEEGLLDITTKYDGWIEKLFVNTTWASVSAGDPLFEIYSPELYNAQLNYLVAHRAEPVPGLLTAASRSRLALFDIPDDFIEALIKRGEPSRNFTYRAPSDGVVIDKMVVQGRMMKAGEPLFRLADLSSVWVNAQIYEKDLPYVHEGQPVEIHTSYGQDRNDEGTVQQLLPQVEAQTRTATARIVLANPDRSLRPGMYVEAKFAAQIADDAVLVPDMAVLRSGERNTVFVALDGGLFEPREITLGVRSAGNFYQVISGLKAGERIVLSGQFMLDSESQLREAIQKMLSNTNASSSADSHTTVPVATPPTDTMRSTVPDDWASLIDPVAFAAADAAAALAEDDIAAYKKHLPELNSALAACAGGLPHAEHGPLGKYLAGLSEPADLAAARREFEPFSTAIADLVRENSLHPVSGLHIFECPMAPETGKARWLQRSTGTKNPFYGSEMLGCGDEIAMPMESSRHPSSTFSTNLPESPAKAESK